MSQKIIIPATEGRAFKVNKGQRLKVIDVEGEQVADFVAINQKNHVEVLDPGATMDVVQSKELKPNDKIYSNHYLPMFTIVQDTVGKHDLLLPACRSEMYDILYNKPQHASCFHNLNHSIAEYGVEAFHQHRPLNIFMNTVVDPTGGVKVERPLSKAGDFIELKAEMDLIIGISACPTKESVCNGYNPTPIEVEIID